MSYSCNKGPDNLVRALLEASKELGSGKSCGKSGALRMCITSYGAWLTTATHYSGMLSELGLSLIRIANYAAAGRRTEDIYSYGARR